ncbi:uncharacterized protein LOC113317554 [Papaver somniferum]|uniref:uncharacterized protein LOC113317554 n=1 Tax=Papaver somniferum TaxID=3469 RepID=UPI000E6FA032|nr:uncharacterized protein LOC113317554 [Papaver somniferum]
MLLTQVGEKVERAVAKDGPCQLGRRHERKNILWQISICGWSDTLVFFTYYESIIKIYRSEALLSVGWVFLVCGSLVEQEHHRLTSNGTMLHLSSVKKHDTYDAPIKLKRKI